MSDRCPDCKAWLILANDRARHVCPPKFECRADWEDDDAWEEMFAYDAEAAAEKYAEHYDCTGGEYAIVSNRRGDTIILVRKAEDGAVERFAIEAETVPQYRATAIQ